MVSNIAGTIERAIAEGNAASQASHSADGGRDLVIEKINPHAGLGSIKFPRKSRLGKPT
jgi:hypothetical protein